MTTFTDKRVLSVWQRALDQVSDTRIPVRQILWLGYLLAEIDHAIIRRFKGPYDGNTLGWLMHLETAWCYPADTDYDVFCIREWQFTGGRLNPFDGASGDNAVQYLQTMEAFRS